MVGVLGLEPRTSSLSETRSSQLSYTPEILTNNFSYKIIIAKKNFTIYLRDPVS